MVDSGGTGSRHTITSFPASHATFLVTCHTSGKKPCHQSDDKHVIQVCHRFDDTSMDTTGPDIASAIMGRPRFRVAVVSRRFWELLGFSGFIWFLPLVR